MWRSIRQDRSVRARGAMALALILLLGAGARIQVGAAIGPPRGIVAVSAFGHLDPAARDDPSTIDPVSALRADQARSIERSLAMLDARFDGWRDRSELLADALLSWRLRGALAWRSVRGALSGDAEDRRELVRERFEALVLDESALREATREACGRLALELRADRARALARQRRAIGWPVDGPGGAAEAISLPSGTMDARLDRELLRSADRSLAGGVVGVVGATVVSEVVGVAVGAAAGSAAAGAAGGSIAPGVGTVIGLAAGLGAGLAVDWWMHGEMREEIVRRCGDAIEGLRREVIQGDPARGREGLRRRFEEVAEREAQEFEAVIRNAGRHGGAG